MIMSHERGITDDYDVIEKNEDKITVEFCRKKINKNHLLQF